MTGADTLHAGTLQAYLSVDNTQCAICQHSTLVNVWMLPCHVYDPAISLGATLGVIWFTVNGNKLVRQLVRFASGYPDIPHFLHGSLCLSYLTVVVLLP